MTTIFNKGNYGEFLTFSQLESLNIPHHLLTNLYLPKKDGTTTEVDLVMLTEAGIYVLDSKNYSGWIFGNEQNRYWTQTLGRGKKFRFFNPIWQNSGHINAIKTVLGLPDDHFKSYIIFSDRCILKKITVSSPNVKVIKRNALFKTIKQDIINSQKRYSLGEIDQYYIQLKKYTLVDVAVKKTHIENIRMKNR